jgi:hypothetical protein
VWRTRTPVLGMPSLDLRLVRVNQDP